MITVILNNNSITVFSDIRRLPDVWSFKNRRRAVRSYFVVCGRLDRMGCLAEASCILN
jgi:hypothetical protein